MARKLSVNTVRMLIAEIKKNPVIYDSSNPDFKNPAVKERKWKKLSLMFHVPVPHLKSKWKNMRDSYAKYLKSKFAPDAKNVLPKWHLAKDMSFMRTHISDRTIYSERSKRTALMPITNCDEQYFEDECTEKLEVEGEAHSETDVLQDEEPAAANSDEETIQKPVKRNKRKPKKRKKLDFLEPIAPEDSIDLNIVQNLDNIELLFVGYARTLKKLSPRRQVELKMRIGELIMAEELAELEEMEAEDMACKNEDFHSPKRRRNDPLVAKIEPTDEYEVEYLEPDC